MCIRDSCRNPEQGYPPEFNWLSEHVRWHDAEDRGHQKANKTRKPSKNGCPESSSTILYTVSLESFGLALIRDQNHEKSYQYHRIQLFFFLEKSLKHFNIKYDLF